jgi:hypothetical protein
MVLCKLGWIFRGRAMALLGPWPDSYMRLAGDIRHAVAVGGALQLTVWWPPS